MLHVNCEDPGQIKIISLSGQIIMQSAASKGVNTLNVQHLHSGLYMLQFTNGYGAVNTQKLLIR